MKSQIVAHSQGLKSVEWDADVEHKINTGSVFTNYMCSWRVELYFVSVLRSLKMLFSGGPKSCIND